MKEKYINKIIEILRNENITVVKAIYDALLSILDKK